MIKKYINEKRSWIILFITLHMLFIFIAYIDPTIPFTSLMYIVFLSFIIFIVFIIIRYHKETKFYNNIQNSNDLHDLSNDINANRPFEKVIEEQITKITKQYKTELVAYQMDLEQEKNELLSWIHEVKTPLTTLKLMIERIDEEPLKAKMMYEWLRMDLLLDQQLHQKRIPTIENDLHIENISFQHIIHKEIKMLQAWCLQKGVGFEVTLQIENVLSDSKWLGFIIRQLLTNAVKYSDQSDITIKSYLNQDQIHLEIIDKGRGIDSKDLPRIFDKGFTSTTQQREHTATGMGLYLVKNVAQPLMIQINVQSQPLEGTKFTLTFPKKNEFIQITSM